jgi:hypothetical protein
MPVMEVDEVKVELAFAGSPETHGSRLASWLELVHEGVFTPLVQGIWNELGPPAVRSTDDFAGDGEWSVHLLTGTLRGTFTSYRYADENVKKVLAKLADGRLASVKLQIHDRTDGWRNIHELTVEGDLRSMEFPELPNIGSCSGYWPHFVAAFGTGKHAGEVIADALKEGATGLSSSTGLGTRVSWVEDVYSSRGKTHLSESELWRNADRWIPGLSWATVLREGHVEALGGRSRIRTEAPCERHEELASSEGLFMYLQATEDILGFREEESERLAAFLAPVLPPPPQPKRYMTPDEMQEFVTRLQAPHDPSLPRPWETTAVSPTTPRSFEVRIVEEPVDPDVDFTFEFGRSMPPEAVILLDEMIDEWYGEWSDGECPTPLHYRGALDFDDQEMTPQPSARLQIDFGSALPGALNDLLRRLDQIADSGLPLTSVTLGQEIVD